jgi:polysaccharide biosynthesis protein PslH
MKDKQKIYVVAVTVPGNVGGGEIRNYNLIKQLVQRIGADLEVFCISSKTGDPETLQKGFEANVRARCHVVPQRPRSFMSAARAIFLERVPPFMDDFRSSGVGDVFRKACEKSLPDVVHIEGLQAYYCIRPHIPWLKRQGVKIVLDCHNIEHQLFQSTLESFSLTKRFIGKFLAPNLKRLEIEAAEQSDAVFCCSASDAGFFKSHNPATHVIPNGVDCSYFQPAVKTRSANPGIIFIGIVGFPPNVDAMRFYLSAIHAEVKERVPNIKLLAIGVDQAWLNSIGVNDPSVKPLGFVEDVRPYLAQAMIGICPLRYGSGTRLKILTYMAAGLAVVSTRKGSEGINYVDGRDLMLADEPHAFAKTITELLNDTKRCEEIGRNGRNFVLKNYDWNIIGNSLADLYRTIH